MHRDSQDRFPSAFLHNKSWFDSRHILLSALSPSLLYNLLVKLPSQHSYTSRRLVSPSKMKRIQRMKIRQEGRKTVLKNGGFSIWSLFYISVVVEWSAKSRACLVPTALSDATKFNLSQSWYTKNQPLSPNKNHMFHTSIFLTSHEEQEWRIVYTFLLPLAFSQTISAYVQRFKMCNVNYQGFLSLLFAGVQDG